jgi:hypothetical protein
MCPFCISALAIAAAKVLSAGGGGVVAAKLALKERSKATEAGTTTSLQPHETSAREQQAVPAALIASTATVHRRFPTELKPH